jgi:hypothetical protein
MLVDAVVQGLAAQQCGKCACVLVASLGMLLYGMTCGWFCAVSSSPVFSQLAEASTQVVSVIASPAVFSELLTQWR